MPKASEVIAIAMAEVGYKEKASNAALDDKTANAGPNNWTKYARDLAQAGYYNGNKNGYAWCDVFVDWCFYKAFGSSAQKIQCQSGDLGASCYYSKQYYQNQGRCDRNPKVGDQVFFTSGGSISHTGLVTEVNGSTIKTVEGNSSDQVAIRSYSLSNSYVDSFGHPLYDGETTAVQTTEVEKEEEKTDYGSSVKISLNQIKRGSKGPLVKTIQRIILAKGINSNIEVDGSFGPITEESVITLQMVLFPDDKSEWDGVVGKKTWTQALTQLN